MTALVNLMSNLFKQKAQLMLGFFLLIISCEQPRYTNEINGYTMGTSYSIKIIENRVLDLNNVSSEIDLTLRDINKQMSTWDEESEISKLDKTNLLKFETLLKLYDKAEIINQAIE